MQKQYEQLQHAIDTAEHIALFVHRSPDGDALGSSLALGNVLEQQGKNVDYYTPTPIPETFDFLHHNKDYQTTFQKKSYDLFICLDTAEPQLLEPLLSQIQDELDKIQTIVIDHHLSNNNWGDLNIVDATASSACELLAEILQDMYPDQITPEVATYLLMGMITDTGNFTYEKDSHRSFGVASYLIDKGANKKDIVQHLYRSKEFSQVKAMGLLLDRMTHKGDIIYSRYTIEDLTANQLDKEQIESFLPLMTGIQHDGIFALFKTSTFDLNPTLRCSLRANTDQVDVSQIAKYFNGGGHKAAAGCSMLIENNITSTMDMMLSQMQALLDA